MWTLLVVVVPFETKAHCPLPPPFHHPISRTYVMNVKKYAAGSWTHANNRAGPIAGACLFGACPIGASKIDLRRLSFCCSAQFLVRFHPTPERFIKIEPMLIVGLGLLLVLVFLVLVFFINPIGASEINPGRIGFKPDAYTLLEEGTSPFLLYGLYLKPAKAKLTWRKEIGSS